jgi:murein DD-endopeptidase MepM/ murein hydrolase activator NlpD
MSVFETKFEYKITSPFGERTSPVTGKSEFHTGIDLVKKHQANIYAFVGGEVIHAKNGAVGSGFGGFGNVVAVLDDKGLLHCYCHLDSINVKLGDKIKEGVVVGKQGNTGKSVGSHLHYEIRKTFKPSFGWGKGSNHVINPEEVISKLFVEKPKKKEFPKMVTISEQEYNTLLDAVKQLNILTATLNSKK